MNTSESSKTKATVCVVDDDDSFRSAVSRMLRTAGFTVQTYVSAGEFLTGCAEEAPGCVLLDVQMPGLSGLDLQAALAKRDSVMPIVFVTGHGDIPMSVQAMRAGAVDFLTKPVNREALLKAVRTALTHGARQRKVRERLRSHNKGYQSLTPREREVFELVTTGLLNKQIAAKLGTTERTIKAHRANIMEKFQAGSLAELVHIAAELKSASGEDNRFPK